jgi:4-hydroxy-tetrahydrodipicolinate reductase
MPVRVIVAGASGRVGRVMMSGLGAYSGVSVVGGFGSVGAMTELARLAPDADVLVDFTTGAAAPELLVSAARHGLHVVSGTSGMDAHALHAIDQALRRQGRGGVWSANFAIGAMLMMYFARIAARFMDAAEVIEMHHDKKVDAPSGTAVQTARDIRAARGQDLPDPPVERRTLEGSRGAVDGGVRIHSVRLPGLNAHQEILFGAAGQVLSIRHDALGREAYLPGVALAVREVPRRVGLVHSLDTLMGLEAPALSP